MSAIQMEIEYVDRTTQSLRYLEHGWPTVHCRWHSHPEYELHLITETRGKAFVGDYIGEFSQGDLFLTGPNVPHNWMTDCTAHFEPVAVRDMLIQFSQESIEKLVLAFPEFGQMAPMWNLARSGIKFEGFDPTFARGHMQRIRDTCGPERIAAFLRFLVRINEHAEKRGLSVIQVVQPEGSTKLARMAQVVDHLARNYVEDISLEDAAEMAGLSPSAFSRFFQKATGNKFVEFVNRIRIGQACSMLCTTDNHISSICHDVGFQNLANFNRQFLRMKKMTPKTYRESTRSMLTLQNTTQQ